MAAREMSSRVIPKGRIWRPRSWRDRGRRFWQWRSGMEHK